MNETITTVVGNVVDDPVRRRLESGVSVASFRVASTSRRFDRATNQWVDGDSLYLRVTCWRSLAENVQRSLVKGDPVLVTGRLFTRLYQVNDARRASYELEATAVGFDLNRGTAIFHRTAHERGATVDKVDPDGLPAGDPVTGGPGLGAADVRERGLGGPDVRGTEPRANGGSAGPASADSVPADRTAGSSEVGRATPSDEPAVV